MTTATETLLTRAADLIREPLLWVMPEPCAALADIGALAAVHSFRPDLLALKNMGVAAQPDWPAAAPAAVALTLPRQVEWACGLLAQALEHLPAGGLLFAIARNDRGGKRYAALLEEHFGLVWSDTKNHCRAAALERPKDLPPIVAEWRKAYSLKRVDDTELLAPPGAFSCDHVDKASAMLARHLPPLKGRVADFGAGWGYLSHSLLSSATPPDQVDLYEADKNALAAAEANLAPWKAKAGFFWRDILSEDCAHTYDAVVMNPPFHDLQDANAAIGQGFVVAAARALKPGGQLWMVANKHLPYEDVLEASFASWKRAGADGGFKVLTGTK